MPRVLVVDDDPVIVRLLEVNLRLDGYDVETASRGEQALERAIQTEPDLVLLDVMMPGLDGWETCRRLRELPAFAQTPVVFLSARAQDDDRSKGLSLGRVAYLTKPFDPVRLMDVVRRMLDGDASGEAEQ
ncbi:MAG: response regulator [Actinobacteria bacterium]|nr:response regulator [Actinomycetota bacterium]